MPELPEVETIRRQLKEVLIGKKILEIEVLNEKSFLGNKKDILGLQVKDILRKAKVIEIVLEKDVSVFIHLKMSGQLIFESPPNPPLKKGKGRHTRVILSFEDGSKLFFNDLRKFGWMRVVRSTDEQMNRLTDGSGVPDVVDKEFTVEYFKNVLKKSKRAIKIIVSDQNLMGGVGNIYANDALYLAKVRPDRASNTLSDGEIKQLYEAIVKVINLGIKYGGASERDYVDTKGGKGTYQDHFLVYQQDGKPCKECGAKILKMKIGGRGTYYCPKCQL